MAEPKLKDLSEALDHIEELLARIEKLEAQVHQLWRLVSNG